MIEMFTDNYIKREIKTIPSLITILLLAEKCQNIADQEIKNRTHIKTGKLISNWKKTPIKKYNKNIILNIVDWEYKGYIDHG